MNGLVVVASIAVSFALGMALNIVPLPNMFEWLRPEWCALVLIYWVIAIPSRVGIGVGFAVGLFLDVIDGTVLGQHALALSVIAYLALKLYQQLRVYPLLQQSIVAGILIFTYSLITMLIQGMQGFVYNNYWFWLSSLTSALFWPWVYILLRDVRRRFVTVRVVME